jgi:hypothetical protein
MSVTTVSEAQIKQRSGEYDLQQVRYLVLERCQLNSLNNITSCIGLVELSLARNEIVDVAGLVVCKMIISTTKNMFHSLCM